MSANTDSYWRKIQEQENNPVGPYQSRWQSQIDNALNAITNRKAFSYDFNADPLYQAYKDQYTKLGKEASMNAAANAAALTGGYGNSYAVTAGAQANQQYLTRLNEVIPELYNLAMNRYKMEGDELNNKYGVLSDADTREYGQYRDKVGDWKDMLAYLQSAYNTQLNNDHWEAEFALKNRPVGGGGTTVVYKNTGKEAPKSNERKYSSYDNKLADSLAGAYKASYLNAGDSVLNTMITEAINRGKLDKSEAADYYQEAKKRSGAAY